MWVRMLFTKTPFTKLGLVARTNHWRTQKQYASG